MAVGVCNVQARSVALTHRAAAPATARPLSPQATHCTVQARELHVGVKFRGKICAAACVWAAPYVGLQPCALHVMAKATVHDGNWARDLVKRKEVMCYLDIDIDGVESASLPWGLIICVPVLPCARVDVRTCAHQPDVRPWPAML